MLGQNRWLRVLQRSLPYDAAEEFHTHNVLLLENPTTFIAMTKKNEVPRKQKEYNVNSEPFDIRVKSYKKHFYGIGQFSIYYLFWLHRNAFFKHKWMNIKAHPLNASPRSGYLLQAISEMFRIICNKLILNL